MPVAKISKAKKEPAKKQVVKKAKVAKVKKAKVVKVKKPRAAPSPKQVAARKNFAAATSLAEDIIYDAGAKGSAKPTWGKALRAAYGNGALSGLPRRRR